MVQKPYCRIVAGAQYFFWVVWLLSMPRREQREAGVPALAALHCMFSGLFRARVEMYPVEYFGQSVLLRGSVLPCFELVLQLLARSE